METIVIFTHHDFTMFIGFFSNANFLVLFVYQESVVSELSCLLFGRQVTCQSSTSSTVNVKMARLTNDQKEACNAILEGHNLILTGQAGTGKTFVLKEVARDLKFLEKRVAILCTTGIGCLRYSEVGATIVHRYVLRICFTWLKLINIVFYTC